MALIAFALFHSDLARPARRLVDRVSVWWFPRAWSASSQVFDGVYGGGGGGEFCLGKGLHSYGLASAGETTCNICLLVFLFSRFCRSWRYRMAARDRFGARLKPSSGGRPSWIADPGPAASPTPATDVFSTISAAEKSPHFRHNQCRVYRIIFSHEPRECTDQISNH